MTFADKVVLYVNIMTWIKGDKDQDLLQKRGGNGFPYLVFFDADGRNIAKLEGERTPAGFEATLKTALEYMDIKKKAEGGDKPAQVDLFMRDLGLGRLSYTEAQGRMKGLELSKEQQEKVDDRMVDLQVIEIMNEVGPQGDAAKLADAGKKLAEMKKAGRIPKGDDLIAAFWSLILKYAEAQKDAAMFEDSLNALKAKFGNNPNAKKWIEQQEEVLKKLKEGKDDKDKKDGK